MRFRKDEGFTLVELMVVVLIIGILVAIAIPVFNAAKANAQKRACHSNQRTIEGAAGMYQADSGVFPEAGAVDAGHTLVAGGLAPNNVTVTPYLKSVPRCPRSGSSAATNYTINGSGVVAACTGGEGTAADHGQYR